MSFGVGLGKFAGQVFRIGHLGQLSIPNMLAGLATIEMAMRDLDYPINAGVGVAAAQEWYRIPISVKPAAGLLSECGVISDE
jgi:alanine-glyoxylate transaminase/serine-glyoxylate transaminase/serine-pyruvate transaminase